MTGLVADIGRTSVRFGLSGGPAGLGPRDIREYATADHITFASALSRYIADIGHDDTPLPSVLAVAGVPRGDAINISGTRWFISLDGVRAVLRAPCQVINDFAANAWAVTRLPAAAFAPISGPPLMSVARGGSFVAIGPGTGLGVAGLIVDGDGRAQVIASEAGHVAFAAVTAAERRFADLQTGRGGAYCGAEALLSAQGLVTAYQALGGSAALSRPEDVTRAARIDPAARAAVDLFADYLGAFVGDMVMAFGAWDGVFLIGSLAKTLQDRLREPAFRRRMDHRGDYARRMAAVPVTLVTRNHVELLGAAAVLDRR